MNTPQTQIKLNLSVNLKEFLESKAKRFGMPVSDYLKHLILEDVEDMEFPVFTASEETEKATIEAMKNKKSSVVLQSKEEINNFFKKI